MAKPIFFLGSSKKGPMEPPVDERVATVGADASSLLDSLRKVLDITIAKQGSTLVGGRIPVTKSTPQDVKMAIELTDDVVKVTVEAQQALEASREGKVTPAKDKPEQQEEAKDADTEDIHISPGHH